MRQYLVIHDRDNFDEIVAVLFSDTMTYGQLVDYVDKKKYEWEHSDSDEFFDIYLLETLSEDITLINPTAVGTYGL